MCVSVIHVLVLVDLVAWCWSYPHFHGVQLSPIHKCDIALSKTASHSETSLSLMTINSGQPSLRQSMTTSFHQAWINHKKDPHFMSLAQMTQLSACLMLPSGKLT
jgi:hypothetical protein